MTQSREPIELYYWPTPNGWKISIMLEECGLSYAVHGVDIGAGEQFEPAFLAISPNNRMPAIVDPDGPDGQPISVFESGAILQYLAGKMGRFGGETQRERVAVSEWLFWQVGGLGPMAGQANHFRTYAAEKIPYAIDRYADEVNRLFGVMNLAPRRPRVSRRSLFDRRHGLRRVDEGLEALRPGNLGFPQSRALARRGHDAAGGCARSRARHPGTQAARSIDGRASAQDPVRPARAIGARPWTADGLQWSHPSGIWGSRF